MKIKKIKLKMREESPNRNKKMRYFKIPLCRNFVRKVRVYSASSNTCQCHLGSKNGVRQCGRKLIKNCPTINLS